MRTTFLCLFSTFILIFTDYSSWAANAPQVLRPVRHVQTLQTVLQTVATPRVAIFNGENLDGWTTVSGSKDILAWEAVDGVLHRKSSGGDIVTEKEYENFIFDFEWKISPGGNSGIKYKFANFDGSWLGCEYQVLDDDKHSDGMLKTHRSGSLYDVIAPIADVAKPVGEYNKGRIIVNGKRIRHYLNGTLIVDVIIGSPEWEEGFKKSKFHNHEQFGRIPQGKILVQDHGDEVWYRNMVVRELKTIAVQVQVQRTGLMQRLRSGRLLR